MAEHGEMYNASGAADPTYYQAYRNNLPKAGEIWKMPTGFLWLCLRQHGNFCNSLQLSHDNRYELNVGGYYTNPARLAFVKEQFYGEKVGEISGEELANVLQAVGEKLNLTIRVNRIEQDNEDMSNARAEISRLRRRIKQLEEQPVQKSEDGMYEKMYNALLDKLVKGAIMYGKE